MTTLGDILYNTRRFFSLQRTAAPIKARQINYNPVLSDTPPSGEYHAYSQWGEERKERLALATSWVFAAINRIAMAALPAKIEIMRRAGQEDEESITNHPLELLVQNPNPDMSREYVWTFTHFSRLLSGKAFWFLYPDSQGNIAELWPMPHIKVRPIPDDSTNPERLIKGYVYTPYTGKEISLPPENVVYLRFPDPFDLLLALSPLMSGSLAVLLDRAQARWNTKTFDAKAGLPTNIISVAPETNQPDFERLKADLKRNIGENMVTRGGALAVERLGMTNEEAEYLSSRKFNKEEIYEIYGIPVTGNISGSSSEAGIKEANRVFINQTVWPYLEYMAGDITTQIVKPFFGPDVFARFSDIRPQDRSLAVQEATQYWPSMTLSETRNERSLDDLPKLEIEVMGQKINLWEDIPLRALDHFLAEVKTEEEKGPIPPQLEGFTGQPSLQDSASPDAMQVQEERQAMGIEDNSADNEEVPPAKALIEEYGKWETLAINRVKAGRSPAIPWAYLPEEESYILAAVLGLCRSEAEIKAVFAHREDYTPIAIKAILGASDEIDPARLALEDEFQAALLPYLNKQVKQITGLAATTGQAPGNNFWTAQQAALVAVIMPFIESWTEAAIADTVAGVLTPAGLGLDATVNARAAEWAGDYALDLAKGVTRTTKELAKAKIKNWLQTGRPLSELEKSLAQVISPQWRASLVASTEVTRAYAQVRQEIAGEIGVVKKIVWQTANDERVCPICSPLNGVMKSINGTFAGGYDNPPAHPRCRCSVAFSL